MAHTKRASARKHDGIYLKGGTYVIRVPQRHGAAVLRGTGTGELDEAVEIQSMVRALKAQRDWQILDAITGGDRRSHLGRVTGTLKLRDVYEAWRLKQLDALRERLSDVDLEPLVEGWQTALYAVRGNDSETVGHYLTHVRTLIPEGKRFPRSALTYQRIVEWLARLKVSDPTKRKYRAALMSFAAHLVNTGVLQSNPVRDVKPPKAGKPRRKYLEHGDVIRLVEKQEGMFRVLSALIHGTGAEISAALKVTRGDIDPLRKTVHLRGTKTEARDRIAHISEWAWPYVEKHTATMTPAAPLFPGVTRWYARDKHYEACTALRTELGAQGAVFEDYRIHDARHTYAVRAIRAGASFEVVAHQLGHADTTMVVKVYGRYRPSADEMRSWERVAAAQDAKRAKLEKKAKRA